MNRTLSFITTKKSDLSAIKKTTMLHPLDITAKTLERILADADIALRKALKKYWPRELNRQINRDISTHLKHKKIKWIDIQRCWIYPETEEKRGELQKNYFYAKLLYLSAINHLEKNDRNASFLNMIYAANFIGFLEGYERRIEVETTRKSRAVKGGKAKEENRNQIRKLIPFLLERSPKGGWLSENKTIKAIMTSKELSDLQTEIKSNYSEQILYDLIAEEITTPDNQRIYKKYRHS